jgi:hypothetical protein
MFFARGSSRRKLPAQKAASCLPSSLRKRAEPKVEAHNGAAWQGRMDKMPGGGSDWLDQLVTWLFVGFVILLAGFAFVSIMEGWRRWSINRRIRKHLRN